MKLSQLSKPPLWAVIVFGFLAMALLLVWVLTMPNPLPP